MKMTKWMVTLCFAITALATVGCGSDEEHSKPGGFDVKEEFRDRNNRVDHCDEYGDGECDESCTQLDPDCSNVCDDIECCVDLPHPDGCCEGIICEGPIVCPSDSEVDYVPGSREDYLICDDDNWSCASAPEGIFDDPECGCGCYIEDSTCPLPADPDDITYVSESPEECASPFEFPCEAGEEYFQNECSCGCIRVSACLDADDPDVDYVGESVQECQSIRFACEDGEETFQNECGCGCVKNDDRPDYCESPLLNYISEDPMECARIDFGCSEGVLFDHPECGCGCYVDPPTCVNDVDCKPGYCGLPPTQVLNAGDDTGEAAFPVCHPTSCEDDQNPLLCDGIKPECDGALVPVARNGCWKCVDPRTCE